MPYPLTENAPTPPYDGSEACSGVGWDLFFTKGRDNVAAAAALCAACPMLDACDAWSLQREEFGYWAGRTAKERSQVRRELGIVLHRPEARGIRRPSTAGTEHLAAAA
jgi:hypothetical protein